jgi:hypothetical protein
MFDALKDLRGWLADWPLYVAGVLGMTAMFMALTRGFALGSALAGGFVLGLIVSAILKDARGG